MARNIDCCFVCVHREGKQKCVCFSDLTDAERDKVVEEKSTEWLEQLLVRLGDALSQLAEHTEQQEIHKYMEDALISAIGENEADIKDKDALKKMCYLLADIIRAAADRMGISEEERDG